MGTFAPRPIIRAQIPVGFAGALAAGFAGFAAVLLLCAAGALQLVG